MPELANTKPVKPPIVNKKIKPRAKHKDDDNITVDPHNVANQLKTLIAVGIAITIVADVK